MKNNLGVPGAILIVISQLISGYQSSNQISQEIVKFREEFQQSLVDREKYFVRKTELGELGHKIDGLNSKIIKMGEQIKALKGELFTYDEQAFETCGRPVNYLKVKGKI